MASHPPSRLCRTALVRGAAVAAVGAVLLMLTASACDPAVPADAPKVVFIGDSMIHEARGEVTHQAAVAGLNATVISVGKAAPCSQLSTVLTQLAKRPKVLVLEWLGNASFTAGCTTAFQTDEVVAEYRAALVKVVAARRPGTYIALVGIPPLSTAPWATYQPSLDALYRQVAADHVGVGYLDVDPAIAPAGTFTKTLPCTATDTSEHVCGKYGAAAGQVVVRDPLGLHFCPVTYDFDKGGCPVYNSGGRRYAAALVADTKAHT